MIKFNEPPHEKDENQQTFEKNKERLSNQIGKQLKKLYRKNEETLENLKQCKEWEKVRHEGDLIKYHFSSIKKGLTSITLHDWMTDQPYPLKLDPSKTLQEEMKDRFRKAGKLERGIPHLTRYGHLLKEKINALTKKKYELDQIKNEDELSSFKKNLHFLIPQKEQKPSSKVTSSPIYKEYLSSKGTKIWVGKSAKANDRLTFQLANGSDWWLHIKGCPGSHVLIRLGKNQEPDPETLKDAMLLALHYSKAKSQGEGEVCFTQRKYVSKFGKGKIAGLVQISKHQTAWIKFDPSRYQALKERLSTPRL